MKKRVLFSLLAIFFAGFGFGGISMAAVVDCATGNTVVQISGGACYDTLADAVAAVPTDGTETTIILTANEVITGNAGVTIATTKNIVLDLNGHTLSNLVNEDKASQVIKNEGILRIVDNSADSEGMITNQVAEGIHVGYYPDYNYATNVISNQGELIIEGGTIFQAATSGNISYAIDSNSTSRNTVLTVNGGIIRTAASVTIRMFCNSTTNENETNVNGGLIEGGYGALQVQLPGSNQARKATVNIYGGTLSGGSYAFYDTTQGDVFDNVQYNIGGGSFEGYVYIRGANISITGGNFEGYVIYRGQNTLIGGGNFSSYIQVLGGTISITGGNFEGYVYTTNGANVSIKGGIFNDDVWIEQDNPSNVSVLSGYFMADLTAYGANASQNFIRGGIFKSDRYEYQGQIYTSDWLSLLDTGYKVIESNEGWRVVMDPVATIGTSGYLSLTSAIAAATDGDMIEILKPGTYSLPATISVDNVTIKGNVDGIVFTHSYSDGGVISQIIGSITFENVKFALTDNTNNTSAHYFQSNNITFTNCIIEGLLFGYGTMTFNNCIFEQSVYAYNMWTWRGDITYNDCTFHNTYSSYFINVYHWLSDPNDRHTITINSGTFTTENAGAGQAGYKVKAAVNIKEAENQGNTPVALQFTVNLNNITTYGTFLTAGRGGSKKYQVDDLLGETTKIDGIDGGTPSYGTTSGGDVVVTLDGTTVYSTPKRDENGLISHIVTFDGTGAVSVNDGSTVAKPVNPTKDCYTFSGRYNGNNLYDFNSVVTSDLALVSKWKNYSCGGGGGGGGGGAGGGGDGSTSSSNNSSDTASGTGNTGTVVPTVDPQGVAANGYTNEMNEAYEFAYANGITTKDSIEEAEMFDGLTRIAMAKMLSQYAINVLGKTPADVEVPTFTDVSADLDVEYANGVTLAYKLGIMGINMPDNKFLPYETVTRAQFGTALSRLLFGIEDGEDAYYSTHLKKLKEAGIITNDDPTLEELRGYVMLMLMRSSKGSNTATNPTESEVSSGSTTEPEKEVEAYFTEAYRKGQIYGRIGDLQRLLKSLGYYNGDINNTFDNNTIDAVFDFQIAMGILPADDKSSARGYLGPSTRNALNQKWAEYKASK